jgi:hypothetical protein
MKRHHAVLASTLILVAVLTVGCGPLKLNYQGLQMGSPLKSLPSRTFVVEVFTEDGQVVATDKPAQDMVRDAIRQELERNGHTCVTEASAANADFRISGSVYQWSFVIRHIAANFAYYQFDVGMKVLATRLVPGGPEFSKKYAGSYHNERFGSIHALDEVFQPAFTAMLRDFTTDPEFLTSFGGQ